MEKPAAFFSIVVPCCNVARYVGDLVAALRAQSCTDWECILSVETSTDGTLARCEALAAADVRFRVVVGPRSGSPATPRNRGLAAARGRYVVWLDGDDWLADEALARLREAIRVHDEPEVVQGAVVEYREDDEGRRTFVGRHQNHRPSDVGRVLTGEETMIRFSDALGHTSPMATMSVCRRDFLFAHGLSFQPGLKYEDNEWTARLLYFARRLLPVDFDIYVYRRRVGSITTANGGGTDFAQYAEVVRRLLLFFDAHPFSPAFARAWARRYLSFFFAIFFWGRHYPPGPGGFPAAARTACFRRILGMGGRRAFLRLSRHAGPLKKAAAPLVLLCGVHPILDCPARAYFRWFYYPLVLRAVRAAGQRPASPLDGAREAAP